MQTQAQKAAVFQTLHQQADAFVIPNPWDPGSARLLAGLGFKALASTSAGYAFSRGLPDNAVGLDAMLAHLRDLVASTDLPVSADLENGYGDSPEAAAATIRAAAATGIVGGSIEDATGHPDEPVYPLGLAVERIRAAAEAARSLGFPFMLTARAENHIVGRNDLSDTIKRLQAYQEAGADVLYAPGLKTREDIAAVLDAVSVPVNVLMGLQGIDLTVQDLSRMGVKRVSVGGSLARAALGEFLRAAHELRDQGTFGYLDRAAKTGEINAVFTAWRK